MRAKFTPPWASSEQVLGVDTEEAASVNGYKHHIGQVGS